MSSQTKFVEAFQSIERNEPAVESDDEMWHLIRSFFQENGLISHHTESFNHFVDTGIPNIVEGRSFTIDCKDVVWTISFANVRYEKPSLTETDERKNAITPIECIWRKKTYGSPVYADVTVQIVNYRDNIEGQWESTRHILLGNDEIDEEERKVLRDMTLSEEASSSYEKVLGEDLYKKCMKLNAEYCRQNASKSTQTMHIATIPVMIMSDLCYLTPISHDKASMANLCENINEIGGYFIVDGAKRVVVVQERACQNRVNIFTGHKTAPKFPHYAEIRSMAYGENHTTVTKVGFLPNTETISVIVPYIPDVNAVPLCVLMKALGDDVTDDVIANVVSPCDANGAIDVEVRNELRKTLEEGYCCSTRDEALEYIGKRGKKYVNPISTKDEAKTHGDIKTEAVSYATFLLDRELFPHLGTDPQSRLKKLYFLGYMTQKLIFAKIKRRRMEDRDHFANKRALTSGYLLTSQFENAFGKLIKEVEKNTRRAEQKGSNVDVRDWIRPSTITSSLQGALKSNKWEVRGTKDAGISQALEAYNYMDVLGALRKLSSPMADGCKIILPRRLQNSQFGLQCPSATPEGKKVGTVKDLAMMALITIGEDPSTIIEILKNMAICSFEEVKEDLTRLNCAKVMVNGDWIGMSKYPDEIVNELRMLRRSGNLNPETSISYNRVSQELKIMTESGRMCRPLIIVENGASRITQTVVDDIREGNMTWTDLISGGYVELIDKDEEEDLLIAMVYSEIENMASERRAKVTHCEFHPSMMFGVCGSIIPYSNHSPSPRNTYQISMCKQAMGMPFTNFRQQLAGTFKISHYPQVPVCMTRGAQIIGYDKMPAGQNATVAVCPWRGYGQEDSIILSKGAIDRGFGSAVAFYNYYASVKPEKGERFCVPNSSDYNRHRGNPNKLQPDGVVKKGTAIEKGDIIIGRAVLGDEVNSVNKKPYDDDSIIFDHPWPGVVDSVQYGTNADGYHYIRVCIAQTFTPIEGDKFASNHGQKGICGKIANECDLPYSIVTGQTPDLIFNPLACPSRMTINYIICLITGKQSCSTHLDCTVEEMFDKVEGAQDFDMTTDATAFKEKNMTQNLKDEVCEELKKFGFSMYGKEQYIDGLTGEPLKCLVYTGIVYYQRLKHVIINKIHARPRGPRTALTHQPREGRREGGGGKIGTMERDNILCQGAGAFVRDRMMEQSDQFQMWVCGKSCGNEAIVEKNGDRKECTVCGTTDVQLVKIPYGTKLLGQELKGMHIIQRILTVPVDDEKK